MEVSVTAVAGWGAVEADDRAVAGMEGAVMEDGETEAGGCCGAAEKSVAVAAIWVAAETADGARVAWGWEAVAIWVAAEMADGARAVGAGTEDVVRAEAGWGLAAEENVGVAGWEVAAT